LSCGKVWNEDYYDMEWFDPPREVYSLCEDCKKELIKAEKTKIDGRYWRNY